MTPPGDGRQGTLGRRPLLAALGTAVAGGVAVVPAAGTPAPADSDAESASDDARSCDTPEPGGDLESGGDVVPVDLHLETRSLLLDPQDAVPVELRPEEPLEPDDVVEGSLRLGPPDVVEAGGGARPEGEGREDDLVYHFPVGELGLGAGDRRLNLVGRTVDDRRIVGTAELSLPDVELPGLRGRENGSND